MDRAWNRAAAGGGELRRATRANAEWRCHGGMSPADAGACATGSARAAYERDGDELARDGLYLDMPAWGYHAFEVA